MRHVFSVRGEEEAVVEVDRLLLSPEKSSINLGLTCNKNITCV